MYQPCHFQLSKLTFDIPFLVFRLYNTKNVHDRNDNKENNKSDEKRRRREVMKKFIASIECDNQNTTMFSIIQIKTYDRQGTLLISSIKY